VRACCVHRKGGRLTLVEQATLSNRLASSSRGVTTTMRGIPRGTSFKGSFNSGGMAVGNGTSYATNGTSTPYHSALAVALHEDATRSSSSSAPPYMLPTPPSVVTTAAMATSSRRVRHIPHGYESYNPHSYNSHPSSATATADRSITTMYRPYTAPAASSSRLRGNVPIVYSPPLIGADPIYDAYSRESHLPYHCCQSLPFVTLLSYSLPINMVCNVIEPVTTSSRSIPPPLPTVAARPYVYYYPPVALQPVHQPSLTPGVPVPPY
jgi:hypothetical protein